MKMQETCLNRFLSQKGGMSKEQRMYGNPKIIRLCPLLKQVKDYPAT